MCEDVRIAIAERTRLKWPQRCPRCGSTSALVERDALFTRMIRRRRAHDSAVGRFMNGDAGSDNLRVPILTCRAHARSNHIGGALLRHDVGAGFLRQSIYVGMACVVLFVLGCLGQGANVVTAASDLPVGLRAYAAWSVVGVVALAWAHRVAGVIPLHLDENFQTVTMRFKDAAYANEFKALNPEATHHPRVSGWLAALRVTPVVAIAALAMGLVAITVFFRFAGP